MKMPNGYGNVSKLPGKRRNPWRARKTTGWRYFDKYTNLPIEPSDITDYSRVVRRQQYATIGYYATRQEALQALANYNESPYDIKSTTVTFEEVYNKWSSEHFETIVPSAVRTWKSAYSYCASLYCMRMKDIRVSHLENTINNADVGSCTKQRIKSLFNMMYKYALRHEIVDKDYAAMCNSVKRDKPTITRTPYSDAEIELLWNNIDVPFVDMVLIGIYTGWRPQELSILKVSDIDIENETMKGGLKTDAGKNRLVPIHPKIMHLIISNIEKAKSMNSNYLFNDSDGQQGTYMTYDKYRRRHEKINKRLKLSHRPHDTRHTFITLAKQANIDEYILKLIVGHSINDVTEKVYTHRTIEDLKKAIRKIK